MLVQKTLTATITIDNFEPGYTYEFVVLSTNCPDIFEENEVLCSGDILTATSTLTCDTGEYEALFCTILVIGLKIKKDADECSRILFDLINDETSSQKHYRCVLSNEGDSTACEEFPGTASGSGEYPTLEACQECVGCPCNPDITPCDTLTFTANYECSTQGAPNPGTLTFCITQGIVPGTPVILNGFTLINPAGSVIYTDNDSEVFTVNGQCKTVANIYLAPGSYIVNAYFNTSVCPESTTQFTFNCPATPPPPPVGGTAIQCCATTGAAGGNSVGNVGGINCYTLVYPSDMDTSEDIVIDFGANGVADKLEIYRGIVSCQDIASGELIASTPYIGTLSSSKSGYCHNVAPNFLPAIGSPSDPENTVVQGCWSGIGVYNPSTNPGVVLPYNPPLTNGSIGLSNPAWADDLYNFNPTHTQVSSGPPPVYVPVNGNGGMEHGRGRLRIEGGTYANGSNTLTVVVHNNGSLLPAIPGNGLCGTNTTAWKFYVHCPACPECEGNFTVTPDCVSNYKGKVDIAITGDYQSPVNIYITPESVAWIYSLLEQGVPYLYRSSNNTYYELSHIALPDGSNYLQVTINDDISAGDTFIFCKVYNGTTYVDADVNDGVWTTRITDGMDCDTTLYPNIDCPCSISHLVSGNTSVCVGVPVNITITINGTSLCNVFQNTEFTGLPSFLQVSNALGSYNQLTIKKKPGEAQVAGTYNIHFIYDCGYGCFLEDDIQIIVKDFNCSVSAVVTDTTCGNNNGSIALTLCGGATVLWSTGSTNTTISGLSPGVYTATITDAQNCPQTFTYTIASDSPVTFTVVDETIDCTVSNAASILVDDIDGGTPPYSLVLSNSALVSVFGPQVIAGPGPVDYTILNASVVGGLVPDTYKVAITDDNGCETAYNVIIDQEVAPELTVSSSSTTCGFNNGIITAYATPTTASQTIYYAAIGDIDCNDLSSGTVASVGAPATVWSVYAGDYTVCVEDSITGCCTCEDITVVATNTPPTAPTVTNRTICAGDSVTLNGTCPSGGNITWYYDSDGTQTIPFSTISNILVTTTYYGQCSSGGCASTLTPLLVTVVQPPQVNAGPDRSRCASGNCNASSVSLTGSCPGCVGCTGQWFLGTSAVGSGPTISVSPATTSNYTYKCTKSGFPYCYNTDTALVTVMTPPAVTVQNISSCTPIIAFSGVVTSPVGGNYTYAYYTNNTCTTPTVGSIVGVTQYYVKVTDVDTGCCTCTPFTANITTNPPLNPTYSYNCNANTITLSVPAGTGCTYSWTKQGSATVLGTSSSLTLPFGTGPGQYSNGTYLVSSVCGGCTSSGSVVVNISTASVSLFPQDICASLGATFSVVPSFFGSVTGNYTYTISGWNGTGPTPAPISGTIPVGTPIIFSASNPGTFTLTVSYTTVNGCIITDSQTYTIDAFPEITVVPLCNTGDLTWGDIITDYNPAYIYRYYSATVSDPCSTFGGTLIPTSSTPVPPGLFGAFKIKVTTASGCCNSVVAELKSEVHLTLLNSICATNGSGTGNVTLQILPSAVSLTSTVVTISGINTSTGGSTATATVIIPANSALPVNYTFVGLNTGTWEFTASTGTSSGGGSGVCTSTIVVQHECCPDCPSNGYRAIVAREVYVSSTPSALPFNGTIKWAPQFNFGAEHADKIKTTDKFKVILKDSLNSVLFTQDNIQVKDGAGATITNNVIFTQALINGNVPLPDGTYYLFIEGRTAANAIYFQGIEPVTIAGGVWTFNTSTRILNTPGTGIYDLTATNKCDIITFTGNYEGIYTLEITNTGAETIFNTCVEGIGFVILDTLFSPTTVCRITYSCVPAPATCSECEDSAYPLSYTNEFPLLQDHFLYCVI